MRRTILILLVACVASVEASLAACDDHPKDEGTAPATAKTVSATPQPSSTPDAAAPAAPTPAPASTWDGSMPPRPVPKTSPTVGSGMPAEVQMKAIAYMTAMSEPRFDDPNSDPTWAADFANKLGPITRSLDHGPAEEKEKLDRVEVVGGGRKIDLMMAAGCDAETPSRAVVTRGGQTLSALFAHGVLVVRCNDARVQCLQSTRDPSDILCTTAPRHR